MNWKTCVFDFETRSDVELKGSNVYVYSASVNADVWALGYCFDDDAVQMWYPSLGEPPEDLVEYVRAGGLMTAHNIAFDRIIWNQICVQKYGFPPLPLEQCRCTMVMGLAMNLPASLDDLAGALGLNETKDHKGKRVALQLAKPRSVKDGGIIWWDEAEHAAKYTQARAYCVQDVALTRKVLKCLLPLSSAELEVWFLNERANDRGIYIDGETCIAAKKFVASLVQGFNDEIIEVTKGAVQTITNVGQIKEWLASRGVPVDSLAKDKIDDLLGQTGLPDDVRQVLALRQEGGKSSVAKIDAMLTRRSADGRVRGSMQYHGASTGRVAHRGIQPGNLPRPVLLDGDDEDLAYEQMLEIIGYVMGGNPDMVRMVFGQPMFGVADILRGLLTAAPGNQLYDFDFTNVEGRGLAWAAGEHWKLDAFRAYDAGEGPDLYKVAAGSIFGKAPADVGKAQRQIGKVSELALGYHGGPAAFNKMALGYSLKIGEQAETVLGQMPPDVIQKAEEGYRLRGEKSGMDKPGWLAAEAIKLRWRAAHPNVVALWRGVEDAAISAVANPGSTYTAGPFKFRTAGSFLFARLPSGRALAYPYPRLHKVVRISKTEGGVAMARPVKETDLAYWLKQGWEAEGDAKTGLVFKAIDSFTKKWGEQFTYAGKLVENLTQGLARDLMVEAQARLEAAGYRVVLSVHDELVSEREIGFGSLEEYLRIASEVPAWAAGLPLSVAGWSGERFR